MIVAIDAERPALRGYHGSSHVSLSSMVFSSMKGGLVGAGSCSSIVSICSAFAIVGRSDGTSCVHRSPTCTTLKTSFFTLL